MTKSKLTKKALLCSILTILLSTTMLIGTTFAWFTDTASTSVNKIQAGTLNVQLLDAEGNSLEGGTLKFKQASKGQNDNITTSYVDGTDILWEPGCIYELQPITIKNNGNLALKYKISISGIKGDAKLNDVIEWTISDSSLDSDHSLAAGASSDALTIKGHMKEDAGNEYQGLSIDGIAITVYATQDTVEYDSHDNTYDEDAVYPVAAKLVKASAKTTVTNTDNSTIITDTEDAVDANVTVEIPAGTVKANDTVELIVDRTGLTADSITYDIDFKVNDITPTEALANPITAKVNIGTGLKDVKVTHNGTAMIEATTGADQTYSYDATTGILTIVTKTFSPFTIEYETDFEASINGIGYTSFTEAIGALKDGQTLTLSKDVEVKSSEYDVNKRLNVSANNVVINLNRKTLTVPNHTLTLLGENITLKNGSMSTTTTNSKQTYGSYAVAASGKNITIDGVTILGGISVTGYDVNDNVYDDVSATITNCTITDTNYYTVCAQGEASTIVKNSTLIAENGVAFFWIEKADNSVGDSSLTYEKNTVTMTGSKPTYNTGGLVPTVK